MPLLRLPLAFAGSQMWTLPQPMPTFASAWSRMRPIAPPPSSAPRSSSVRQSPRPIYSTQPFGAVTSPCDSPLLRSPTPRSAALTIFVPL
jgi:hypothetical protein